MTQHLTPADYRQMPWANGKGVTVEMLRIEENGVLLARLSRASVVENGEFSIFPNIERNLTVISGPGFDLLAEGLHLQARPLVPVAFAGDVPVRAAQVTAPSDEFTVMTARHLPRPEVAVMTGRVQLPAGGRLAIFALLPSRANGVALGRYDVLVTQDAVQLSGQAIVVRL